MGYYIFRLKFDTAVHFGATEHGGKLERNTEEFGADSLFSALLCELSLQGMDERIPSIVEEAKRGALLLSDLFPWEANEQKISYYLPKPKFYTKDAQETVTQEFSKAAEIMDKEKEYRGIKYICVDELEDYWRSCEYGKIYEMKRKWSGTVLFYDEKVDCRKKESAPYYVAGRRFLPNQGLYFFVKLPESLDVAIFSSLVESLGLSGIGGKKSSGFGKFHLAESPIEITGKHENVIVQKLAQRLEASSLFYVSLSMMSPEQKDLSKLRKGCFALKKRSGFSGNQKRRDIYMILAGSVFQDKIGGRVLCVGKREGHDIWRYGKGFYLGVDV